MKHSGKTMAIVLSIALAVGLCPAPAFAGQSSSTTTTATSSTASKTATTAATGDSAASKFTTTSTTSSTAANTASAAQQSATTQETVAKPASSSGTCGSCKWSIDSVGTLAISPASGSSGTLASITRGTAPWYSDAASITSVYISTGVSAGSSAALFYGCGNLGLVALTNLNTANTTDMSYMFYGCRSMSFVNLTLTTSNVTDMSYMFSGCTSLAYPSLSTLSSSRLRSAVGMFSGCTSLTTLDLHNFITTAATSLTGMFDGCPNLQKITLGSKFSFKGAGSSVLTTLSSPAVGESTGKWVSELSHKAYTPSELAQQCNNTMDTYTAERESNLGIGSTFTSGGLKYKVTAYEWQVSCIGASSAKSKVTVPSTVSHGMTYSVASIAPKAFYGNKKLTKLTIGSSVRTIGASAFANCNKLKTVIAPNYSLTSIGKGAFSGCTALKSVTLGGGLKSISSKAFYGDKNLSNLKLGTYSLTTIGSKALKGVYAKAKVTVPWSKASKYKKMLQKAGISKSAIIKKGW